MDEKKKNPSNQEMLETFQKVKSILISNDERPIIEYWAFLVWGVLILTASSIHFFFRLELEQAFLILYLPVFLIGGLSEIFAWIQRINIDNRIIFTRKYIKFIVVLLTLLTIAVIALRFLIYPSSPIAALLLLFGSGAFLLIALASYTWFLFEGFILFTSGILFLILDVSSLFATYLAAVLLGIVFLFAGIHQKILARNEEHE
jgi:hypothetical protein